MGQIKLRENLVGSCLLACKHVCSFFYDQNLAHFFDLYISKLGAGWPNHAVLGYTNFQSFGGPLFCARYQIQIHVNKGYDPDRIPFNNDEIGSILISTYLMGLMRTNDKTYG